MLMLYTRCYLVCLILYTEKSHFFVKNRKSVEIFNSPHERHNRCLTDVNQCFTNICKM